MKQIIRNNYLDFLSKEAVFVEKEVLIDELKNVIKLLDLSSFVNFAGQESKLKFMDELLCLEFMIIVSLTNFLKLNV